MEGWNTLCITYVLFLFAKTQTWRNIFVTSPFQKRRSSYMQLKKLVIQVQEKISLMLPDRFPLLFDGCSTRFTHYVALFGLLPHTTCGEYRYHLLNFSPLQDEQCNQLKNTSIVFDMLLNYFRKRLKMSLLWFGSTVLPTGCFCDFFECGFIFCALQFFKFGCKRFPNGSQFHYRSCSKYHKNCGRSLDV